MSFCPFWVVFKIFTCQMRKWDLFTLCTKLYFSPGQWNMLDALDLTQEFNKENENLVNSNTFNLKEESPSGNKAKTSQQSKNKIEG